MGELRTAASYLLLLSQFAGSQLLLLATAFDFVAHSIKSLLFLALLGQTRSRALALHPVVSGRLHFAVHNSPHLLGQVFGELSRVSNDDHTTLEGLESLGQGTERVTVEVV